MKKRLARRVIRKVLLSLFFIVLLVLLTAWIAPKPPIYEFKLYHNMLSTVESVYIFNHESFTNAEFFRNKAYDEWQKQNKKFILIRDYKETERLILIAISIIEEAGKNIKKTMDKSMSPSNSIASSQNSDPNFEQSNMIQYTPLDNCISVAILHSKNKNTPVLIIDKLNHSCYVIENGVLIHNFHIEMGINFANNEISKNDYATSEGSYYITSKKEDAEFNNHKTLFLNFSNKEDSLRFENALQNNEIPNLDVLADKLMIHGNGGKGYDWTEGSIALSDWDMDILYSKVKIGTMVVVVGTTESLLSIEDKMVTE